MRSFSFDPVRQRTVFGAGSAGELIRELSLLRVQRAMLISSAGQSGLANTLAERSATRVAGLFARAVPHVPAAVVEQACAEAKRVKADCLVAIGGGSAVGLAKGVALCSALPIVAIPTTYAGSEVTTIYGITEGRMKRTGRNSVVLPRTVIYDPCLTLDLPRAVSVTSAMNAIAHAAEGLYAEDCNPLMQAAAEEGIRKMVEAIQGFEEHGRDVGVRCTGQQGAWMCGLVLSNARMGLHHALCHIIGGAYNVPHAETHSIILPHVLHFNAPAIPVALGRMKRALEALGCGEGASEALFQLASASRVATSLREIGVREEDLDVVAESAIRASYPNPRPLRLEDKQVIREMLQRAFEGRRPGC